VKLRRSPSESRQIFHLGGQVAIVTGGSKGIGRAIAEALADAGASVAVVVDRDVTGARRIATSLKGRGVDALAVTADVSVGEEVDAMITAVAARLGSPTILVNNAGTSIREPANTFSRASWDRVIAVNLTGPLLCSQGVFPAMKRAGGGCIINVASMAGLVGIPGTAAYSASKGGLVQLTRALAVEWAPLGIRINAIAPCPVETDLSKRVFASQPDVFRDLVSRIPIGRVAQPSDIAGAAVFLASAQASMITGVVLPVDGGWTAQ
jgi:NAD(P)-dependent dehydrogenase (short-subunit alcohol dehydrogenase family)